LGAGLARLEQQSSDEAVREQVRELRHINTMTLREIRRLSHGLHPSNLDALGLKGAIEQLGRDISKAFELSVTTQVVGLSIQQRFAPAIEIAIFRITQEALNNVAKHADATVASVLVARQGEHLRVVIEDDGRGLGPGLEPAGAGQWVGRGLAGMRERAKLLDGSLRLESSPGQGTTVAVEIPLEQDQEPT